MIVTLFHPIVAGELHQTKTELEQLQTNQDELSAQHSETQIKLKALTEYFETKEQSLHRWVATVSRVMDTSRFSLKAQKSL